MARVWMLVFRECGMYLEGVAAQMGRSRSVCMWLLLVSACMAGMVQHAAARDAHSTPPGKPTQYTLLYIVTVLVHAHACRGCHVPQTCHAPFR